MAQQRALVFDGGMVEAGGCPRRRMCGFRGNLDGGDRRQSVEPTVVITLLIPLLIVNTIILDQERDYERDQDELESHNGFFRG